MVFSSHWFLFVFLPITLASYFVVPLRFKNGVLLFWSYIFYAWGAPKVVLILFVSSAVDYLLAARFSNIKNDSRGRKCAFVLGLVLNISLLVYFKYTNFFVAEFNSVLNSINYQSITWPEIALPIGISFFTFQKISYLVDVYIKRVQAAKSFVEYALYVAMFPQLIAGPIIRYHDVAISLSTRTHSVELIFSGIFRFSIGLAKKVLIADTLGHVVDNVFAFSPGELTPTYAWLGILCYSFQIYFDFSGYSDMAIGLGRIFGFRFLENFNMPYISQNITEFWRRWHMSLSGWMKEYLYIPLGGNKISTRRTYLNLWLVFLLSGLWHGASWTFIFWGAYHGLFLVIDRVFWKKLSVKLPRILNISITFLIVLIGWVFFRADNFTYAGEYLGVMFGLIPGAETLNYYRAEVVHNRAIFVLLLAAIISFTPASERLKNLYLEWWNERSAGMALLLRAGVILPLFFLSVVALATLDYSPFLYFRF